MSARPADKATAERAELEGRVPKRAYRTLRRLVVAATATVALVPLFITTFMNYVQYRDALQAEAVQPMARLTLNTKRSLELFFVRKTIGPDFSGSRTPIFRSV